jgi:hypothetical protein
MPAEFNHIFWGLLMVAGSSSAVMIFVQLHETRRRVADLGLKAGNPWLLSVAFLTYLLWMWVGCSLVYHPGTERASQLPMFALLLLVLLSYVQAGLNKIRSWRQRRKPAPFLLSRGSLLAGIQTLARKAGKPSLGVYVVPDDFRAQPTQGLGPVVLIPRRFLDWMSRSEIDALAARQLARQQREYVLPPLDFLLVCGLAAVGLCELLHAGIAGRSLVFLVLVAAETVALALYFPRAEVNADLRAIGLTGNPVAFFSAVGESARLNGAALNLPALEKTAQRAGVSADRLRALLQPRSRPEEDRYPTSGDYVTVGF